MIEVLEKAFKFYEKREAIVKEINTYRQTIPVIEQQLQPFLGSVSWAELEAIYIQATNIKQKIKRKCKEN